MTLRRRTSTGFTLIELLVVIAIIGILAALTGAAVQKVRDRGRDVQCRSDISQLEAAIAQFKSKFGVYPPCYGGGPAGSFRLQSFYTTTDQPEVNVLLQMFPRMNVGGNVNGLLLNGMTVGQANPVFLDPNQCLVFFLSGGNFTGFTGFSTNPSFPFKPPANGDPTSARLNNGAFFDFSGLQSRLVTPKDFFDANSGNGMPTDRFNNDNLASKLQPWFMDPWGRPYLYFTSQQGNDYPFDAVQPTPTLTNFNMTPWNLLRDPATNNLLTTNQIRPFKQLSPTATASNPVYNYMNARSFQIISGGRNQYFGNGGVYAPGSGMYTLNKPGGDDFSNFQQTPLGVTD